MKKRNVCMLLAAALSCSLLLTGLRRWRDQHHHPGDQHPVHQHQRPRRERRRLHRC